MSCFDGGTGGNGISIFGDKKSEWLTEEEWRLRLFYHNSDKNNFNKAIKINNEDFLNVNPRNNRNDQKQLKSVNCEKMNFTNTKVYGFESALSGMRNPMNSWSKNDTYTDGSNVIIGANDMKLAQQLIKAGSEHCKFLRMIQVWVDINMPRYWWSEADTYHFNTKNSTSTMHKLLNNSLPITRDLFVGCVEDSDLMDLIINRLEDLRIKYKDPNTSGEDKTKLLVRAKRLLPEGFLQMRTVNTNYAELRNMYLQRKHHRLKEEWQDVFCNWVLSLPYAHELICYSEK